LFDIAVCSAPFSPAVQLQSPDELRAMDSRFSNKGSLAAEATIHRYDRATDVREGPTAFRLLVIQFDDWQAVDAEGGGDLAAVVDVVLEDAPDDRLVRDGGPDDSGAA
jgi:hypothetical protein